MEENKTATEATNSGEETQEESMDSDLQRELEETRSKLEVAEEANRQLEDAKRQLTARTHKAEQALKAAQPREAPPENINNKETLTPDDIDIRILQSNGMNEERIEFLKKIARINGTSILAAQQDDMFKTFNEKLEEKEKAQKASTGASKGSPSSRQTKDFNSVGLTPEEHKQMWKQKMGI